MRLKTVALLAIPLALLAVVRLPAGVSASAMQTSSTAASSTASAANNHPAVLVQLMRGIMFPNSNIVFSAEGKNPDDVPPAKHASSAANPLEGPYGKWEAVENSSLVIVEAANLLAVPGRLCSNGKPVPTTNADWPKLVQGLRDAGMQSYQDAQTKNQDKMGDAAELMTKACANCHVKYRDTEKLEDRCRKD
jgi:hypothetical protein